MAQVQDIYDKVEKLRIVDARIASVWHKFSLAQIESLSQSPLFGPWYSECVFTTGSQIEGSLYARMFLHGKHISEVDFMFSVGRIADPENQLEPIQHLPGYYSVRSNGILECFHDGVRQKFLKVYIVEPRLEFLSRSSVLNMTINMFSSTRTKTLADEFFANTVFPRSSPCKMTNSFEINGPSAVTRILGQTSDQKHLCEVLVDTVPCFELLSWPDDWGFEEFYNRHRKWPCDPQIIKQVKEMVHIVPKSSPKLETESERENCWRLSFSKAEMHFMDLFSDDARRVYLLFKVLYYANIKRIEINEKTMASYFCKTTMLWMMEEEGSEFFKKDLIEVILRV